MARCANVLSIIYDIVAQAISILDVVTDVLVLVGFYQAERYTFFYLSLSIIILALLSYTFAFGWKVQSVSSLAEFVCLLLMLLPFSPCIPFMFYFCDDRHSFFAQCFKAMCCLEVDIDLKKDTTNDSKLKQFKNQKLTKHLGFVLESLFESFPQSILQMIAIVYYRERNIISIVSIFLSLLSVVSKSFIFAVGISHNIKQLFFNWIAVCADFYGLFFFVAWIFYRHDTSDDTDDAINALFDTFQGIWWYNIYIGVLPLVTLASLGSHAYLWYALFHDERSNRRLQGESCSCRDVFSLLLTFVMTTIFIAGVFIAGILCLSMSLFLFLPLVMYRVGTRRVPDDAKSSQLWFTVFNWIDDARASDFEGRFVQISKSEDRMMRLSALHYIALSEKEGMFASVRKESQLKKVVEELERSQYMQARWSDFAGEKTFWWNFFHGLYGYRYFKRLDAAPRERYWMFEMIALFIVTWVLGGLYVVSRAVTLALPFLMLAQLYIHGFSLWDIDTFQAVLMIIYLSLMAIIFMLLAVNYRQQYLMYHVLSPEIKLPVVPNNSDPQQQMRTIVGHYASVKTLVMRRSLVFDKFGIDIGSVILSYISALDQIDSGSFDVTLAKTL